jgi:hypothetical protein
MVMTNVALREGTRNPMYALHQHLVAVHTQLDLSIHHLVCG